MAHKLITGTTLSGKSTLARAFVADADSRGIFCPIYDPLVSPEWQSEHVTDDEQQFFAWIREGHKMNLQIFAVIDEADTLLTMSHRHNWWLFTRGRHFGMESCAITQRPKLIAPTVRNQCSGDTYVFNLCSDDAKDLANDLNAPDLIIATTLPQGEFLHAHWRDKKKVVDRAKIF